MPALLTRMSTLPNAPMAAAIERLGGLRLRDVAGTATARRPSASTARAPSAGRGLVAAIAERDVGALLGEPQHDRPTDSARAAGDDGRLAAQIDHERTSSCDLRTACRCRRPSRRLAGHDVRQVDRDRARRAASTRGELAAADRIGRGPVGRHPELDVLRPDRVGCAGPSAGSAVHCSVTAPDVKPAPNATMHEVVADLDAALRRRPRRARAARTRPTCSRSGRGSTKIRSIGRSRPLATASMIRMFAWCGTNRSMSSGGEARLLDRREGRGGERLASRTGTSPCPPSGCSARAAPASRATGARPLRRRAPRSCTRPTAPS